MQKNTQKINMRIESKTKIKFFWKELFLTIKLSNIDMATSFGLMQTTPKHLVTCIAPKRSMMFAPAPRKTNKKCKQIAEK